MRYLLLLVNLVAALWVFYDSQKHGYSIGKGLLWAIGVFFLLIVFLPLYLIVRKRKERLAAQERQTRQILSPLTPCFYCGQGYEGDPKVCPHCGQTLKMG